MNRRTFFHLLSAGGALLMARPSSAGPVTTDAIGDKVQTVTRGQLPDFADTSELRQLYQYAVDHGEDLQYIPCTCGCERFGHKGNRDCYIKATHPDGSLTFTSHAAT